MLTISKLSRWSITYYNDTAAAAKNAATERASAGGGLGEYYSEHDTRTPVWLCAGDTQAVSELVGLSDADRAGGDADARVVARWLDEGIAPNNACGRAFSTRSVHGFDLTFCAPKSVSLIRALGRCDITEKAVTVAHNTAVAEALEYLARHAGYTRVHNQQTGEKDLVRLPGLAAVAYQHETSRSGDPHLHTHVIVPNRQPRADGALVSIDGTSLYHEARAAGVIYQATLRRELNRLLGVEWAPVDTSTGMAEVAGIEAKTIRAWSQRSSALRDWANRNLTVVDGDKPSQAQLALAQKATRPAKPEELSWAALREMWAGDARGLMVDRGAQRAARGARVAASRKPFNRRHLAAAAGRIEKAAFTRADLVEIVGAHLPIDTEQSPREIVEASVDLVAIRLTAPRLAHQREGQERFTLDQIVAEEVTLLNLVDARDDYATISISARHTAGLSADQARAIRAIGESPWLVQPLSAPAGAGKTTSLRALHAAARDELRRVIVMAPTGRAVDVSIREGAGDEGYTIAKALKHLRDGQLWLGPSDVVVVDEAAMVGTPDLRHLLKATTAAGCKTVLVGDAFQLDPVKARGGMFAQLCTDLPWAQRLSEVWRMRDPNERAASLALRSGGPAPLRRAITWYADHGRLRTGDPIAMAHDALAGYHADRAAGKDALLVCDTREMAGALNRRIHHDTIDPDAPTVAAAQGDRVAVGDIIVSSRNDATISVLDANRDEPAANPVRNGNRWRVYAIDTEHRRIAARRLDDNARAVFAGDYLTNDIRHGYAITVHAAQGATAHTTHAVLGDKTDRAMLYVAMTRGREANTAYICEKTTEATEASQNGDVYVTRRGTSRDAARVMRMVAGSHDESARTAHAVAADTDRRHLPDRVRRLLVERRITAINRRRIAHSESRAYCAEQLVSLLHDRVSEDSCGRGLEL